jgi:hypothetical protein
MIVCRRRLNRQSVLAWLTGLNDAAIQCLSEFVGVAAQIGATEEVASSSRRWPQNEVGLGVRKW